jgi:hypothetical protein
MKMHEGNVRRTKALSWKRRVAMRFIGIACGLLAVGLWQVYKHHRRDTSVCAQLFSHEEIERWGGEPIVRVSGGVKDHQCSYTATARDHGFELHRDLMVVRLEPTPYAAMLEIHTAGRQSSSASGLGVPATRYPDLFDLESLLVDLGNGSLVVSMPPRVADQHFDEIMNALKTRLDPLRSELQAHKD